MLHFDLKKRALFEELQEKQEQVKDWLQNLGLGEHTGTTAAFQGHDDDYDLEDSHHSSISRRDVPSSAALPVIRPTLGRSSTISMKAMSAMQDYLNHFLGSLDIVNTREVCRFLEVSRLSFVPEYGPKLKEGFVQVRHLTGIHPTEEPQCCLCCRWICCCNETWHKVWAVLKPGFLALLADPYDVKPLDIVIFDVLPSLNGGRDGHIYLAKLAKERNPLRFGFMVACGNRTLHIRIKRAVSARDWVAAINDAGLRPPEGWCHPHRYGSFAPPRGLSPDGSEAQWFIDGKAAFDAIASALQSAMSEIFIADWWLCPELYLRRPYNAHEHSRLDALLEAKAKMGVKIYILLYKEVALTLKINSMYSKRRLLSIHENVTVLRFPDHFSSGVYLWSHHEKLVIVDHQVCFLGGLDLCFGRYDTPEHRVHDHPSTVWPGKDYYNPRESEPNSWEDTMKDELDRQKYPRMPWHDVQCAIWGPACRDIARHFVQRWNYAKRSKAPNEPGIPLLLPHHHMVLPHYLPIGEVNVVLRENGSQQDLHNQQIPSTRSSFQDIPLLFPQEDEGGDRREAYDRLSDEAVSADNQGTSEADLTRPNELLPLPNGFHEEWSQEQEELEQVPYGDERGQVGPRLRCSCQVVRSVGLWSAGTSQPEEASIHAAYCSLINKAEHFIYIENQFFISGFDDDDVIHNHVLQALFNRIMEAHRDRKCFRVIVVIPLLPGFQGGVDDYGAATVRAIMHWQYRSICRGRHSLLQRLYDAVGLEAENYVSFYGLRNYGKLSEGGPLVTSQVYVHSKIMVVDDRTVLIGSANINDRSLLGSRDSEVAVVLEDQEFIDSYMNCEPWKAGKFVHSLRTSLWAEHLGLSQSEMNVVVDPICDTTYSHIWMATSQKNTAIYDRCFGCIPNDYMRSRTALRQAVAKEKEKVGHTTIDLGMALEEPHVLSNQMSDESKESVDAIRGLLVCFPLQFLDEEDLRPVFKESEYYASAQVFH